MKSSLAAPEASRSISRRRAGAALSWGSFMVRAIVPGLGWWGERPAPPGEGAPAGPGQAVTAASAGFVPASAGRPASARSLPRVSRAHSTANTVTTAAIATYTAIGVELP